MGLRRRTQGGVGREGVHLAAARLGWYSTLAVRGAAAAFAPQVRQHAYPQVTRSLPMGKRRRAVG
jgi:hypothetical protein